MKITGLITEYNPFHNGHLYHMEKSKELTGADYCIVLMSGSFVQRGAPAVYDKYFRTSMALQAGADLVLEMPVSFSTASAKEFAAYAVALFTALGAVDNICFGSECGVMAPLLKNAAFLSAEPEEYSVLLKKYLKDGMTFPEARQKALRSFEEQADLDVLRSPNNILGTEYCLAAHLLHSPISLHTIKREGNGYHDSSTAGELLSAAAIRKALSTQSGLSAVRHMVPPYVWEIMVRETPVFLNDFSAALNYRIWEAQTIEAAKTVTDRSTEHTFPMEEFADMTPELASRILKDALVSRSFEERIQELKSRQITYTRVSRALLHLLLNITAADTDHFKQIGYAPYARVLGFRKEAAPLLSCLKAESSIPLITKLADAPKLLSPDALMMLKQEIAASHLYQMVRNSAPALKEKDCAFKNEYTQPIIIL